MRVSIKRQRSFEGVIVVAVVEIVGIGQWQIALHTGGTWIVYPDLQQSVRRFYTRGWAEQQSIDKAKHRRVQANAQGQCDDHRGSGT